jgi:outer membrane protein OmpA-like peptidoglycan-associated protein
MNSTNPWYRSWRVTPVAALLAMLALLAVASRASATGEPLLAVFLAPVETDGVVLREVLVKIDGRETPVRLPAALDPLAAPVLQVPLAIGPHTIDVEVRLDGHGDFLTYLNLYHFKLRGHLDLEARAGQVTAVKIGVVEKAGMFLPWEDRHQLALSASWRPADVAGADEPRLVDPVPALASTPVSTSTSGAAPARASTPLAAAACALEPVGFGFDQAVLTPDARQALDRFAACLGATPRAIRIEGHCDVRGSAGYNQAFGQRRADAVVKYLRERGLTAVRFTARSLGTSRPLCGEASEACHARNRRVEAVLSPDRE